jgi:hypothetical protein
MWFCFAVSLRPRPELAVCYEQVIGAFDDGKTYDKEDAQLQVNAVIAGTQLGCAPATCLQGCTCCESWPATSGYHTSPCNCLQGFDAGTPRFYIMRLPERGLKFNRITFHAKVADAEGARG